MSAAAAICTPQQKAKAVASLKDPTLFATNFLRSDVWPIQRAILRSIQNNQRTAVRACHASGKTFTAALAALWWIARWKECVIVTTAPTAVQVEKLLWGEIHSAIARSLYPFPEPLLTELKFNSRRYAMGFTTSVTKGNEGVRFQGFHGEHVLVILDEAPGVDPKIWEAIEGARAGGDVRILALGNPTIASGPFYDAFTSSRSGWSTFTISAFDTPNLAGLTLDDLLAMSPDDLAYSDRPYLTTRQWVREKYDEWGPGHPLWESRVLGQFPSQAEDALLSLAWLEAAKVSALTSANARIRAGLDVAGPGEDETVLTLRRGPRLISQKVWAQSDPRGEVVAALTPYKESGELESVNVDSIGIGWGMYLHLQDLGFPAVALNVGEAPNDSEKFANLKAELCWGLRERAQSGDFSGALDEKSIGQLAGIRYKHNARGQIIIESKEDARKRGVKSPDRAESIMLAYAEYGVGHLIYRSSFTADLIFDPATMPPGFGNAGSYQERYIAVGYGTARPMAYLEIIDDGDIISVLREYFEEGAKATKPKNDTEYAADLELFMAGKNPQTGEQVVIRSNPTDAAVILSEEWSNFSWEISSLGLYVNRADTELAEGIKRVGDIFKRKLVRVSSACTHFIAEHRSYAWDAQKVARGVEEPIGNKQTVEAFRHYVKTRVGAWRVSE